MSYSIHSVENDQCLFLIHTSDLAEVELAAARSEAHAVLDQRQWKRLVVDVTRLHSVPTSLELLHYAKGLAACASRPMRVALVVRPEQQRPAKLFEKAARHGRVFVTYFVDPQKAVAWVSQTRPAGPARRPSKPSERHSGLLTPRFTPQLSAPCCQDGGMGDTATLTPSRSHPMGEGARRAGEGCGLAHLTDPAVHSPKPTIPRSYEH